MLKTKSFLAVDFGAGSLKLAEFQLNDGGGLSLINYAIKSLGLEGASQEAAAREALDAQGTPGSHCRKRREV